MTVVVKVSDLIKHLKEIRDNGIKEISLEAFPEGEPEFDIPPHIEIKGVDPDGFMDHITCGTVDGRAVDW
ncbi:MAG: hypothetical protein E7201_02625 [Selenomonas ruminantium]|uniref:Uncharacterized protein n=1 Tax=Selenomonas ruminantium TaxID=971 RepID=A0A927ZWY8_SELRU|nr:hypothetical protein [Selenomonas ruminantium]